MNFKTTLIFVAILAVSVLSCKSDAKGKGEKSDPNLSELYRGYFDNPSNQGEFDQNAIIDYAMEHNLSVTRTESGLYYAITQPGNGPTLRYGERVKAHYRGYFMDGTEFDSSYSRGTPLSFQIGQMNQGWNEGLTYFSSGSKGVLLVPSRLAYGEKGFPGYVPPHTVVGFDIEVLF